MDGPLVERIKEVAAPLLERAKEQEEAAGEKARLIDSTQYAAWSWRTGAARGLQGVWLKKGGNVRSVVKTREDAIGPSR